MRKPFYRVASSRFSTTAVAVVAFAALELLAVQPAFAGIVCCTALATGLPNTNDCLCDASSVCNRTLNNKLYNKQILGRTCWNTSITGSASTIKSELSCTTISEEIFPTETSFKRTGIVDCTVSGSTGHDGEGRCAFEITYKNDAGLTTSCNVADNTSTRTVSADCSDVKDAGLTVTGTLQCPKALQPQNGPLPPFCKNAACILRVGVEALNAQQCANAGLGTILSFSETVEGQQDCDNSDNWNPEAKLLAFGDVITDYCNGGDFSGANVSCFDRGKPQAGGETSAASVQVEISVSPTVLNVSCNENNNDVWRVAITANQTTGGVSGISPNTLRIGVQGFPDESRPLTCGAPVNGTLSCEVSACNPNVPASEDLGTLVGLRRNRDRTVDLAVTGSLVTGAEILGVKHVTTSGQVQP
jgi:hypothetical protein